MLHSLLYDLSEVVEFEPKGANSITSICRGLVVVQLVVEQIHNKSN